jgi:hypothetical protein
LSRHLKHQKGKHELSQKLQCEAGKRLPAASKQGKQIMKYALLVHQSQEYFDRRNDAAAMAAGRACSEALQAAGVFVGGAGLESPQAATTVSVRDGKRHVHDCPYAETKEFLAGFGIIDVPNLDAALEWAARHPAAAYASVEIRPLLGSLFLVGAAKTP